jgi:hypothetical protein
MENLRMEPLLLPLVLDPLLLGNWNNMLKSSAIIVENLDITKLPVLLQNHVSSVAPWNMRWMFAL